MLTTTPVDINCHRILENAFNSGLVRNTTNVVSCCQGLLSRDCTFDDNFFIVIINNKKKRPSTYYNFITLNIRPCVAVPTTFHLFIYLWPYWFFVAECGLSPGAAGRGYSLLWHCGAWASHRSDFSLWIIGFRYLGFSSWGTLDSRVQAQ